jgi:hypothetical protein
MPPKKPTKKRAKLLAELEYLVGSACYNASIQNWGPGGAFEGEGRDFRYPLTVVGPEGDKKKVRYKADSDDPAKLVTGYYAFGANQLQIMMALDDVLRHLELNHDLKI